MAKFSLLGVGLLFGGWVGAEAGSHGPARYEQTLRYNQGLHLDYKMLAH